MRVGHGTTQPRDNGNPTIAAKIFRFHLAPMQSKNAARVKHDCNFSRNFSPAASTARHKKCEAWTVSQTKLNNSAPLCGPYGSCLVAIPAAWTRCSSARVCRMMSSRPRAGGDCRFAEPAAAGIAEALAIAEKIFFSGARRAGRRNLKIPNYLSNPANRCISASTNCSSN